MEVQYDPITGIPTGIIDGNTIIPIDERSNEFLRAKPLIEKQKLDLKTPVEVEKPAPAPSQDEKIAALESMVKRLSGDTKQTDEEIDLMVKTGLITEDTAATMKAEA